MLANIQTLLYTFPLAHWRVILLIHDLSYVFGGKLHSE